MVESRLALLTKTADVPGTIQRHHAGNLSNLIMQNQAEDIPLAREHATRVADISQQRTDIDAQEAGIELTKLYQTQNKEAVEEGIRTARNFLEIKSQGDLDIWRTQNPIDAEAVTAVFDSPEFAQAYRGAEMMVNASRELESPDRTLVEVADPNSPTGTRFVPRAEASGMPGKPPSGTSLEVGPDGSVILNQGRGAQPGPSRTTSAKLEQGKFDAVSALARVNETARKFNPRFLEIDTRFDNAWSAIKEKAGIKLDDNEKRDLIEFSEFKQAALQDLNLTLNELAGAAVSVSEFDRISSGMPNPGTGLFDGDSPTEFEAKMKATVLMQKRAIMRYNYALRSGIDPLATGIELADVDALYDRRGAELEGILKQKNPNMSDDILELEVRARLKQEFGM